MVTVVVADDQPIMRRALEDFIAEDPAIELVGSASNGGQALELVRSLRPDVLLTDLDMPVLSGVQAIAALSREGSNTRAIALTTFSTTQWAIPALRAGASGYLVKDSPPQEILRAIHEVSADSRILSPAIVERLVDSVSRGHDLELPGRKAEFADTANVPTMSVADIPQREFEVLELLSSGLNNREIAAQLFLSESSVKSYLSKLCMRLGVRDRVQLVVRAVELGLVRPRLHGPDGAGSAAR